MTREMTLQLIRAFSEAPRARERPRRQSRRKRIDVSCFHESEGRAGTSADSGHRGLCDGRAGRGTASRYDSPRQGGAAIAGWVRLRAVAGSARDISSTSARATCLCLGAELGERASSGLFCTRDLDTALTFSARRRVAWVGDTARGREAEAPPAGGVPGPLAGGRGLCAHAGTLRRRSASPRPSGASRWLGVRPGGGGGSGTRQRARGAGGTAWATAEGGRGGGHGPRSGWSSAHPLGAERAPAVRHTDGSVRLR